MADFTGMVVQVTMKEPTKAVLFGKVKSIVAGQSLTIEDVYVPASGEKWPLQNIPGHAIADLQVVDPSKLPPPSQPPTPASAIRTTAPPLIIPSHISPHANRAPLPLHHQRPPPPQQALPQHFVDPAILSYARSPAPARAIITPVEAPATPVKAVLAEAAKSLPTNGSPFVGEPSKARIASYEAKASELGAGVPSPREVDVSNAFSIEKGVEAGSRENGQDGNATKKKLRRGQKKKGGPPVNSDPPPVMNVEVSRNGNDMTGGAKKAKGWRQDPLLQPGSPAGRGPPNRMTRRQREEQVAMQSGWATEDATDVQEMGDFDFEANNKLFDKPRVFDEIRKDDTTADEDRLVSHNKMPRPGTHGGKNLHPTENVLSPKIPLQPNSGEGDSSSDADTEQNGATGRSSSRHSVTRSALGKMVPSRQNSAPADGKPHPLTTSISSDRSGIVRSATSLTRLRGRPVPPAAAVSPQPDRQSPRSATSLSRAGTGLAAVFREPHFMVQSTQTPCKTLLPIGMENLETQTIAQFGLTPESVTESAARCVVEVALSMFDSHNSSSSRRGSRAANNGVRGSISSSTTTHLAPDSSQLPVVVVLAGNHTVGARAVAAARYIANRKIRIILAEASFESKDSQDPQMRAQTSMLKRLQRMGAPIKRGTWTKALGYIKNLSAPPVLIIDALLAGATYGSFLEEKQEEQQAAGAGASSSFAAECQRETLEMIHWANRSRAPVLSVACPSGVSGQDGSATVVEGEPLAVRPDKILSLGVPLQGVLEAMKGGEKWEVSLADVGVNITLNSEDAVGFGRRLVVDLGFVEGVEAGDGEV